MSLRESALEANNLELSHRRDLLRHIGACLVNKRGGKIYIADEEDLWFLRDNIKPEYSVGKVSGLDLITKLYSLIVGRDWPEGFVYTGNKGKELMIYAGDKNTTKDTDTDESRDRPGAEIEPGQALPPAEGKGG